MLRKVILVLLATCIIFQSSAKAQIVEIGTIALSGVLVGNLIGQFEEAAKRLLSQAESTGNSLMAKCSGNKMI